MGKISFTKKYLGLKKFWIKNYLGQKVLGKKNLGKKKFGKILIRFFFCLKKQVGSTQGGGYMTAPPLQKIVGFKLCWIVVSFAW